MLLLQNYNICAKTKVDKLLNNLPESHKMLLLFKLLAFVLVGQT